MFTFAWLCGCPHGQRPASTPTYIRPDRIAPGTGNMRAACAGDVQRLCADVPSGGGRIIACLKQHQDEVSAGCKQAIASAMGQPGPGAGSGTTTPTAPVERHAASSRTTAPVEHHDTSPKIAAPNPVPSPVSHVSAPTAGGPGPRYFLMKQVQLIDQHADWGKPAYHLMLPTAWQFKGWVDIGVMKGQGVRKVGVSPISSPSSETQKRRQLD